MRTTQNIPTVWESFFKKFSCILKFFISLKSDDFQEKNISNLLKFVWAYFDKKTIMDSTAVALRSDTINTPTAYFLKQLRTSSSAITMDQN